MKKYIFVMIMMISFRSFSQIDFSMDLTPYAFFPTVKVTYPLYDKLILGGAFGYDILSPYLDERIHGVVGWKVDEQLQIEADLGVLAGTDPWNPEKRYMSECGIGIKYFACNFAFFTMQLSFPTFAEVGIGFRFRPYKKLSVWDNMSM